MNRRLRKLLLAWLAKTSPKPPDQSSTIRKLNDALVGLATREDPAREAYMERVSELIEARQMAGAGPWQVAPQTLNQTDRLINRAIERFQQPQTLRESMPGTGMYGDIELALQNVEWRREVNLSWLEFSRWGIQQIILICRLHYIKHPWIRHGVNLSAAYVFGQGVEISSPDPDANEVLKQFRERNKSTLGQIALVEQEKRKSYDGNLFWCLFADTQDKGEVNVRLIDATEIQEIQQDPNDADKPQFYRRVWTQRTTDLVTGQVHNDPADEWYPALSYALEVADDSGKRMPTIGGKRVNWDKPVYHRAVGHIAYWAFGCPRAYAAIDWAREGRKHLQHCRAVVAAQAQIALTITTKGGQQALEGIKGQFETTAGPDMAAMDGNPPAMAGSMFASGPGTQLQAFKTRGAGPDPGEVKEYRNMAACALEVPPTWLGDMETSNLSTALTLDRPTELGFMLKQEEWQEDLVVMGRYALMVSKSAPSGQFRAALTKRQQDVGAVSIREAGRKIRRGHWTHEAAKTQQPDVVEVLCTFPAIREGDIPSLVRAVNDAMAIDRQGRQHGIDDKTAVRLFCRLLDVENSEELVEKVFPDATYELDRTKEDPEGIDLVPAPPPVPAPAPKIAAGAPAPPSVVEAKRIREVLARVEAAIDERNGTAEHAHAGG